MYGQMTAGSWIYIGTQGIVQGTYETFAEAGRQHFGGDMAGTLGPDRRPGRHGRRAAAGRHLRRRRVADGRVPAEQHRLPPAHPLPGQAGAQHRRSAGHDPRSTRTSKEAVSIGLLGNAAEVLPELVRRAKEGGLVPDLVTDQTSAHDLIHGYLPRGWTVEQWQAAQQRPGPHAELKQAAAASCAAHVQAILDFKALGAQAVDYGNNIRQVAFDAGRGRTPSTSPASCRPISARSSAKAAARSAGWRCPATRKTSTRPTPRSRSCSRSTRACTAGSTWRASASPSRACRRASAGWAWASATWPAWPSTRWCARAN